MIYSRYSHILGENIAKQDSMNVFFISLTSISLSSPTSHIWKEQYWHHMAGTGAGNRQTNNVAHDTGNSPFHTPDGGHWTRWNRDLARQRVTPPICDWNGQTCQKRLRFSMGCVRRAAGFLSLLFADPGWIYSRLLPVGYKHIASLRKTTAERQWGRNKWILEANRNDVTIVVYLSSTSTSHKDRNNMIFLSCTNTHRFFFGPKGTHITITATVLQEIYHTPRTGNIYIFCVPSNIARE